jgi:cyclic pyranopterin phosphate synthase
MDSLSYRPIKVNSQSGTWRGSLPGEVSERIAPARRWDMLPAMLSHIDDRGQPAMVNVGDKMVTRRTAHAVAVVTLPPELAALLKEGEIATKKGAVFQTAILAGVMGAKRTSELIPLCHPLGLDDCLISVVPAADGLQVDIHCRVQTHGKTGVEMEALTGATVAALTIYDMGKAVSHGIVIREVRLLEKTGGKRDYHAI